MTAIKKRFSTWLSW